MRAVTVATRGTGLLVAALVAAGLHLATPAQAAPAAPAGGAGAAETQVSGRSAAASCAGFRNRVGITRSTITIANVSDLTGPIPSLNRSARQAVRAFVSYFNKTSSICGRKLRLLTLDTRTDPAVDRTATITACRNAFAAVGSLSVVDQGGATRAELCGLPDLRAQLHSDKRFGCGSCFATRIDEPSTYENAVPDYLLGRYPSATQSSAMLHLNAFTWPATARTALAAETTRGMSFSYAAGIDVAEFNYGPYVQQLVTRNVKLVQAFLPPAQLTRLAQAMGDAGYAPTAFVLDPAAYGQVSAPEFAGALVPVNHLPLDARGNAELVRYRTWLARIAPSAEPTAAGLFAWSAARLFVRQARALGGRLNRPNLVASLRGVHGWRGLGTHAAEDVGGKRNGNCWRFLKRSGDRWVAVGGTSYRCSGHTVVPPS